MEVNTTRIAVPLLFLVCAAARAQRADPPPLGKLVDVGGYRVHLNCTGDGGPTVVITGAGFSFDWALVQPEVARFAHVCTYDPAGTAWSDPGPGPGCSERVEELRQVLHQAGVPGPYVLAGLSIGGLVARLYAARHPEEVAGVVLVDHTMVDSPHAAPAPAAPPGPNSPPALLLQTPIVMDGEDDSAKLPPHARELHRWAVERHPAKPSIETAEACLVAVEQAMLLHPDSLQTRPLAVVSTGNQNVSYVDYQQRLLALSRNSRQFVAARSGHGIEIDQPEVVVKAIRDVVDRVPRSIGR